MMMPQFTPGRFGHNIRMIVIHHWGRDGQDHHAVVRFLRDNGNTDAHSVISYLGVTPLVAEDNTAWHAGNWPVNLESVGLECRPECSPEDFEMVAQEVARLRRRYGNIPLTGHRDHYNTACPGRWYPRLAELSDRANAINAGLLGSQPTTAPTLTVDGVIGPRTISALQTALGTLADGVISDQWSGHAENWPAAADGWQWSLGEQGSACIAELQRRLGGLIVDGLAGPKTAAALQARLGVKADGYIGPVSARALQTRLNTGRI